MFNEFQEFGSGSEILKAKTVRLPTVCLLFFYLKFSVLSIFVIVACHMFGEIPLDMCCVIMYYIYLLGYGRTQCVW
jgi:hypothetical protein